MNWGKIIAILVTFGCLLILWLLMDYMDEQHRKKEERKRKQLHDNFDKKETNEPDLQDNNNDL